MRYGLVFLLMAAAAGCTVGSGSGTAVGPLWIVGCKEGENFGSPPPGAPADFDLNPTFFAGEPIEDIADGPHINRLIIRMQRNGNGVEVNDTLYFDIPDSGRSRAASAAARSAACTDYAATTTGSIDTRSIPTPPTPSPPP